MPAKSLLNGKRILVVDDEPDVLDSIEQLLPMCRVVKAASFHEAESLMETEPFEMAILDIMGVNGYGLLDLANEKNIIAVMLTAHALSPDNLVKSYRQGAASYIPKEAMHELVTFLEDILVARERGKSPWWRCFDRLCSYFDKRFGPDWQMSDEEFWKTVREDI